MGITLISLHIFSDQSIDPALGRFRSFSKGWQTMLLGEEEEKFADLHSFSRTLSKKMCAPVLTFFIFDSDEIALSIHDRGKQRVSFSTSRDGGNTGIFQIPGLVGYPEGYKRRISEILSCSDIDLLTELLEEFFGVALLVNEEIVQTYPDELERSRGEAKYLAFHKEEMRLRGKAAPIRAVLTQELPGKLFVSAFGDHERACPPAYYLFGYDTEDFRQEDFRMVQFANGHLEEAYAEPITRAQRDFDVDSKFHVKMEFLPRTTVTFLDKCPDAFQGKTLVLPSGFYLFAFDSKQRLVLTNYRNSIVYMNAEGKIIAKVSVKGEPVALIDDYLLTAGSTSFYAYVYSPQEYVRIYRLEDRG